MEIHADTYKIHGPLFIPLVGKGGYGARLADFLNHPQKHFLALSNAKVTALPNPEKEREAPFVAVTKNAVTMVRAIKGE